MAKHESYLWVERYKPHSVEECILPQRIKDSLNEYAESGQIKNYIAVGPAGCGKTSSAMALLEQMNVQYLFINASSEGSIDTIRNKVTRFATTKSILSDYKVVVLDECDYLSMNAQAALRGIMEQFYQNCRFILTANFGNRVLEPLKSRAPVVDFSFSKAEKKEMMQKFLPRIAGILDENEVTYDKKELVKFCVTTFPDFRRTLNLLQRASVNGVLDFSLASSVTDETIAQLSKHIIDLDFDSMSKWVAENVDNDGHVVRRALYDKLFPRLKEDSIPALIMILNDYDRYEVQVKDLEIHMKAMCITIMQECEFLE